MHGARTGGPLLAVTLCLAIAFGLSGCGDEPSSAPETGSAPATSSQPVSQEAERPPVDPLDACGLLTAEQVGVVVGQAVTGSPERTETDGSSCQFLADDETPLAGLLTILEAHYDGGFDELLAKAQEGYSDPAKPVTVAGFDGYLLAGSLEGKDPSTTCFVLVDGVVVASVLPGDEPEVGLRAQALLALALGAG